jgi:hypothetical protein
VFVAERLSQRQMFGSRYMPCPDCGASLERRQNDSHECDLERWLDYQLFQLRQTTERFEEELAAYLSSPHGRFELWYAQRERKRTR